MDNIELDAHINELVSLLERAVFIGREYFMETDIFYNGKWFDYVCAKKLDLRIKIGTQGCDAYEKDGSKVELKSTLINKTGKRGSFQFHWLSKNKLKEYKQTKYVYFIIRDGCKITEAYKLPMDIIYPFLEKKAKEKGTFDSDKDDDIDAHWSISSIQKITKLGGIKIV
jgi:hypothetical protein